ncbi:MAG: phenylacetate--CoA ligase family protein, partial [Planctomycetaceae bacterium]
WDWCMECWRQIWTLAGLQSWDRLFFPFSFGPFLGFWAAFEGALRNGNFCLAGGGMSTLVRLHALIENEATVLCCTPTYALRMAETAAAAGIDLKETSVRMLIVAGEPGGSISSTRQLIEQQWDAKVIDHWGMTELGSLATESVDRPGGMYLLETECIAEVTDAAGNPVPDGETGELVITNLGRLGSPLLRYRTGDLVTVSTEPDPSGRVLQWLQGGILGRADDMLIIRGNNVFPGSVEAVVREFPAITEFQLQVSTVQGMKDLCVAVETPAESDTARDTLLEQLRIALRQRLGFAASVQAAATGSLPRSEMKSRRVVVTD